MTARIAALAAVLGLLATTGCSVRDRNAGTAAALAAGETRIIETGCGSCIFHMPGVEGCPLAVRIDGKCYLVEGSGIDDHGDAHAADGLCNALRRARASGRIEGGVFVASSFTLVEE